MEEEWYIGRHVLNAKYMPEFMVLDTESSHGRYAKERKKITVNDLIKFHGHACDGLFRGVYALSIGLSDLFPEGVIDRTDLRILSRNSPCLGDVGSYLTGARVRFGTQDVMPVPGVWFIIQKISDKKTVKVVEEEGFFPHEITDMENNLAKADNEDLPSRLDKLRNAQENWLSTVLFTSRPKDHYFSSYIDYNWKEVPYSNVGQRTDVLYKHVMSL